MPWLNETLNWYALTAVAGKCQPNKMAAPYAAT
jgi:hypothetical protein